MPDTPATNHEMIVTQVEARGVRDLHVLTAMERVDRAHYVPADQAADAYADCALAIAHGQTISQPYIVGLMTQLLAVPPNARLLEVGTGSGYQTAILAELMRNLTGELFTLELNADLAEAARQRLLQLGYTGIHFVVGNGWQGLPDRAPFDGILVAAAAERLPEALVAQLAPGGRLVVPVGVDDQELMVITRAADGTLHESRAGGVRFVPLIGG